MATTDSGGTANDPFTGRPAEPVDPAMLQLITRKNTIYCFHSIPGVLFFYNFNVFAPPEEKLNAPDCPKFMLDCGNQEAATYTRLYTRWLFSGGVSINIARVHNDGTISFRPRLRSLIYWTRRHLQTGARMENLIQIANDIMSGRSKLPNPPEDHWNSLILRTEPIEKAEDIWIHALPTQTSSTQQPQPQPRSHPFNTTPTDVPYGWTTWKPFTVPAPFLLPRPPPTHIDPIITAPTHTRHIHGIDRRRAEGIPNITAKEDAAPATFDLQDLRNVSRSGVLKLRACIREQLSHAVNPPKRNTRKRKREIEVPLNFDFGMFGHPTSPCEYETEDETDDERLWYEVHDEAKTDAALDDMAEGTANLAQVEMERVLTHEMMWILLDRKKMGLRKMGLDEEAMATGYPGISALNTLFVPKDWE